MLLSNSRIDKNSDILFYEQDILLDNQVYSGNIQVTVNLDYINPGIGIALISNEGISLESDGETYLFRLGHSEYSIIRRYGIQNTILESGPVVNVKPFKENLKLILKKINNKVYFYVNDKLITQKSLTADLSTYTIGYYSNAGNIIKSISIASEIPDGWIVNMKNTNGGYIEFDTNKFRVSDCLDLAEVEQVKVSLKQNEQDKYYYLNFEKENINDINDFKAYVFFSDDDRYNDEEKNILDSDGKFSLKKDAEINIKFVGTKGIIKNVQITTNPNDFYVETSYDSTEIDGSYITIKTTDLEKIEWSGIIYNTPEYDLEDSNNEKFGIIQDENKIYYPQFYDINKRERYDYTIYLKSSESDTLVISNDTITKTININIISNVILFKNMDAIIDKLLLYKKDGTIENPLLQDTYKEYVPGSITSPIIVTSTTGTPLDLSASYRIINVNGRNEYVFTNIEREIFEPANKIKLTKMPSEKTDTLVVYGVHKNSDIYEDYILCSKSVSSREINSYCDSYDLLTEDKLYKIDRDLGYITLADATEIDIKTVYKKIVVDYLKKDSYAINYNHILDSFEVDISCTQNTDIYYDGITSQDDLYSTSRYKILNTTLKNNNYIVLKGVG